MIPPLNSFDDLGLSAKVIKAVKSAGYTAPTPIQSGTIPHVLQKKMSWELLKQEREKQLLSFCLCSHSLKQVVQEHECPVLLY